MSQQTIHLPLHDQAWRGALARTVALTGLIAAAFCLTVAALMLAAHVHQQNADPLTNGTLIQLKEQLADDPENEALKQAIRQADLEVRRRHLQRQRFLTRGSYLLLGGLCVALACGKAYWHLTAKPYLPDPQRLPAACRPGLARTLRASVGIAAAIAGGGILAVALLPDYRTTWFAALVAQPDPTAPATAPVAAGSLPPREVYLRNWPMFRGPGGCAVAPEGDYPTDWDGSAGKNILWKTRIPLPGYNSPIVWNDSIFLSGATETQRLVYCVDAATGGIRWQEPLPIRPGSKPPQVLEETGLSPSTLATDGLRVYAMFPDGDVAAFDFSGKRIWMRSLGPLENQYGHATSLLTVGERLIVQLDQGSSKKDTRSAILALDGTTGRTVWSTPRPVPNSWTSPILADTPSGLQIITAANPYVIAYDPADGREIWRAGFLSGDVAPSPAYAAGMVFAGQAHADLAAIRTDGQGDVTDTHIAWKADGELPEISSPLATGDHVFMVTTPGLLTCLDAKSGKMLWEHDLEKDVNASPILVGRNVYLTDTTGVTHIFEAADAYKPVAAPGIGEAVHATAAFSGGRIYIRGKEHLYCIAAR